MKRQIPVGIFVLLGAAALYGQTRVEYAGGAFQFAGAGSSVFGGESIGSQVVTGKPFSAVEERHSVQVLGDGTRIESKETNRLYRDDQGRTRIEPAQGNITIFDPVAGFRAEINPTAKTVSRSNIVARNGRIVAMVGPSSGDNTDVLRSRLAKLREEMSQLQSQFTDQSPRIRELRVQISNLEKEIATPERTRAFVFTGSDIPTGETGSTGLSPAQTDELKKQTQEAIAQGQREYNEQAIAQIKELASNYQAEYAARNPTPGGGLTISNTTPDGPVVLRVGPGDNASVESLPAQMVNGALAQGTRTTETIPVGKIGNDRAISIVNERWYSSDLQMLVKSTSSDPRFGDTTYQLTNIVQAAPDPSLFQIPADYIVRK